MTPEGEAATLVATLRRCCQVLDSLSSRDDVPMQRLAACRRGLVVASVFMSAAEQAPVGALGVDFVTAARWLCGYYGEAAANLTAQSRPTLLGSNGQALNNAPTAAQLGNVAEALIATASAWREIAEAARDSDCDPGDLCELHKPCAKHDVVATVPGILRIWTAVVAGLAQTVTSQGAARSRQEVVVLTQVMVQTAREAGVMAAMLGGEAAEQPGDDNEVAS